MLYQEFYQSPLGEIRLLADNLGLSGLYFVGQKYDMLAVNQEEIVNMSNSYTLLGKKWLDVYFSQQNLPSIPLSLRGTAFQTRVRQELQKIPFGDTKTYGELAKELNCPSAQAVGGAIGKNPISLIIPCHRVLGRYGQLTGYAGGLERKSWLLEYEKEK
ncbi:TPA: methylated-DNA--[protein]-cysteine S-methyltransferase [Streptococcus agalactiae]|nr:methylated-DNA--[protein]-cysteine S-methyltransferase [Streptococcus agalactiae]HEN6714662.1 methylated-DNA--[protein]-cysteine S-methyltransferase [Streptococcus agalactiae]HEN7502191.1 methylated-DNA--[protein]-cysteine S-methyltransferase [Streptococcus agalactiae]HEN7763898.1 methylated-DNA--[protein]-cysteine S-methyltransferase [Streptococcus agalactiae]HEN7817644.1 methylated-DNA--[protein]-cysteine S-methyltransferase [Streptococcus agalactiae]